MVPRRSVGWSKANMPRSKRGRSAPDYDSDHEDHLAASDDDDALMDDDDEEALTDDEEEEVFEECEEMDEDEDDDIDQCSDGGEDEHDGGDDDDDEEDDAIALAAQVEEDCALLEELARAHGSLGAAALPDALAPIVECAWYAADHAGCEAVFATARYNYAIEFSTS